MICCTELGELLSFLGWLNHLRWAWHFVNDSPEWDLCVKILKLGVYLGLDYEGECEPFSLIWRCSGQATADECGPTPGLLNFWLIIALHYFLITFNGAHIIGKDLSGFRHCSFILWFPVLAVLITSRKMTISLVYWLAFILSRQPISAAIAAQLWFRGGLGVGHLEWRKYVCSGAVVSVCAQQTSHNQGWLTKKKLGLDSGPL